MPAGDWRVAEEVGGRRKTIQEKDMPIKKPPTKDVAA